MTFDNKFGFPVVFFVNINTTDLSAESSISSFISDLTPRFFPIPTGVDFYPTQVILTGSNTLAAQGTVTARIIDDQGGEDGNGISGCPSATGGAVNIAVSPVISSSAKRIASGRVIGALVEASVSFILQATSMTVFVFGYLREAS